jgi:hypothetical protein
MNVAEQALDDNNLGRAISLLDRQRPKPGQKDLRGWEWRYLWRQTQSDAELTLCHKDSEICTLAVSPDGRLLATSDYHEGRLSLWDLQTRKEVVVGENLARACRIFAGGFTFGLCGRHQPDPVVSEKSVTVQDTELILRRCG